MKAGPPAGLRLMFHKPGGRGGRTIGTWASIMNIDGAGSRSWRTRTIAARAIAAAQTSLARQRRHWAQTAVHAPYRSGR